MADPIHIESSLRYTCSRCSKSCDSVVVDTRFNDGISASLSDYFQVLNHSIHGKAKRVVVAQAIFFARAAKPITVVVGQSSRHPSASRQSGPKRITKIMKAISQLPRYWKFDLLDLANPLSQIPRNIDEIVTGLGRSKLRVKAGKQSLVIENLSVDLDQDESVLTSVSYRLSLRLGPSQGYRQLASAVRLHANTPYGKRRSGSHKNTDPRHAQRQKSNRCSRQRSRRSPSLPPNNAIANAWLHARADSIPQLLPTRHFHFPLWTGWHFAMSLIREKLVHG